MSAVQGTSFTTEILNGYIHKYANVNERFSLLTQAKEVGPSVDKTLSSYYGSNGNLLARIQYVAYRIWNAVKAIVGYSDWQISSKKLDQFTKCTEGHPGHAILITLADKKLGKPSWIQLHAPDSTRIGGKKRPNLASTADILISYADKVFLNGCFIPHNEPGPIFTRYPELVERIREIGPSIDLLIEQHLAGVKKRPDSATAIQALHSIGEFIVSKRCKAKLPALLRGPMLLNWLIKEKQGIVTALTTGRLIG